MRELIALSCLYFCMTGVVFAQGSRLSGLRVGDQAPNFALPYATRDSIARADISLSSFLDKRVVILAFYPADWSGGCTKEVCTFRDEFSSLSKLNAEILAISGDYVYSHFEWAKHHNLPFKLLSDHDHAVARAYGSFNETTGYNLRTVYVIDREGKIRYADLAYSTRDDASFVKLKAALVAIR